MKSWFESSTSERSGAAEFVPFSRPRDRGDDVVFASDSSAHAAGSQLPDREDLERRLREAVEVGREAGRAEGAEERAEMARRLSQALDAANDRITQVATMQETAWREAAVDLALVIAEHVLQSSIGVDRDSLLTRIAHAIEPLEARGELVLHLSSGDLEWFESEEDESVRVLRERPGLQCVAEPSLAPGEMQIAIGGAFVDGTIEAMLDCVRSELGRARPGEGAE